MAIVEGVVFCDNASNFHGVGTSFLFLWCGVLGCWQAWGGGFPSSGWLRKDLRERLSENEIPSLRIHIDGRVIQKVDFCMYGGCLV